MFRYACPDSNSKDYKDREKVFNLVKKYFSLDKDSLRYFEKELFEPEIDDIYAEIIGRDNTSLRKDFTIPLSMAEKSDLAWIVFKESFASFCEAEKVTYSDFLEKKIKGRKLFKFAKEYYVNLFENNLLKDFHYCEIDELKIAIDKAIEKIGTFKNIKDKKMVLSVNFVDSFFCSTENEFTSCLDLNSSYDGAFWAGLPGLIGDKNRAIFFSYEKMADKYEIEHYRMSNRVFILLNKDNELFYQKWYPKKFFNNFEDIIGKRVESIEYFDVSKHPVNLLFNKSSKSLFIYNDKTTFNKNKYICSNDYSAFYYFNKSREGYPEQEEIYCFSEGLGYLIDRRKEIAEFEEGGESCYNCNERVPRGEEVFGPDGQLYCENCFEQLFITCYDCNEVFDNNDVTEIRVKTRSNYKYVTVCNDCLDSYYYSESFDYYMPEEDAIKVVVNEYNDTDYVSFYDSHKLYFVEEEEVYYFLSDTIVLENGKRVPEWKKKKVS